MADRITIRLATPDDAEGIRTVYAPYVATPITFEEEEPLPEAFRARMEEVMGFYPCLVACEGNGTTFASRTDDPAEHAGGASDEEELGRERIVGFAYAHRQAERAAYDWNAELTIYLHENAAHRGVGTTLYRALMELLKLQGVRCAYARVTLPNPASEHLHARFGFGTMGIQRNAGFRCGAWRDVAWYTLPLGPFDADPARPTPFPIVLREQPAKVRRIVEQANERRS